MRDELTQKQRTFAHAWIENGGNDYQAAIDAGYSQATAKNARKNILEKRAVKEYIADVKARTFPAPEHTFKIDDAVLEKLY